MSPLISIGQIIDHSLDAYVKHFSAYLKVTVWYFAVFILSAIGTLLGPAGNAEFLTEQGLLSGLQITGMVISQATSTIGIFVISIWIYITLLQIVKKTIKGEPVNEKMVGANTWKLFLPYALVAILLGLIMGSPLLLLIPGIGMLVFNSILATSAWLGATGILMTLLGILGGIVLLIIFTVWFAFPGFLLILDGVPAMKTFRASKELVKNRFWPVFMRLMIPKMLFAIIVVAVQIGFYLLEVFFMVNLASLGESFLYHLSTIVTAGLNFGIMALSLPLFVVADYLIYDSLKTNR
ncbi:MAG: hypothetical protein WC730_03525 [Patescibacteria group bacterium]|jgi:hypothetical protein